MLGRNLCAGEVVGAIAGEAHAHRAMSDRKSDGWGESMARLRSMKGRSLAIMLAAGAILVVSASMGVASHVFSDVPTGAYYHDDVEAIFGAGITAGCGSGNYCPNSYVRRGDMAVFLNKLGALGPGTTPVANQRTAQIVTGGASPGTSVTNINSIAVTLPDRCPGGADKWTIRATANGYFLTGADPSTTATVGMNIDSAASFISASAVNQNLIGTGQLREIYTADYVFTNVNSGSHTIYELASVGSTAVSVAMNLNRFIVEVQGWTC